MAFNNATMRRRRLKLGLSQEKLARKMDVACQTVYRWEAGAKTPSLASVDALAKALGVQAKDLIRPAKPGG